MDDAQDNARKAAEARGTFACPICGFDKPHTHDHRTVEWHRTGQCPGFQDSPLNENQRHTLRLAAESHYRQKEIRDRFDADPVQFLRNLGGGDYLFEYVRWAADLIEISNPSPPSSAGEREVAWLIEGPDRQYLSVFEYNRTFIWTKDHAEALRFSRQFDAGGAMCVAKTFQPELFDGGVWERTKPVEHMWVAPPRAAMGEARKAEHHPMFDNAGQDSMAWAILQALHTDVPEEKRPTGWADCSDEQIARLKRAADAVLAPK